jgi:hypothetical protein
MKSLRFLRRYFPGEFSWRLYAVLQVAALIAFALIALGEAGDGRPPIELRYRTVREQIEMNPKEIEAARARCAHLSDDPSHPDAKPVLFAFPEGEKVSPREDCFRVERPPSFRAVGREVAGIERLHEGLLVVLLLALLGPFVAFRVTIWVWEGWRNG